MKNTSKLVLIALSTVLALAGCKEEHIKASKVNGYVAKAWTDLNGNHHLKVEDPNNIPIALHAYDIAQEGVTDEEFDKIERGRLLKGHPLEKYANLQIVKKIYEDVSINGKDLPASRTELPKSKIKLP